MKLERSAALNDYVKLICLSHQPLSYSQSNCFVTGWGDTEDTGDRQTLNQVSVGIIKQEVCQTDDYYGDWITSNMFCAGEEEGGKDACQTDDYYGDWITSNMFC